MPIDQAKNDQVIKPTSPAKRPYIQPEVERWGTLREFVARDVDRLEKAYTATLDSNKVDHFHERAVVTGPNTVRLASGR